MRQHGLAPGVGLALLAAGVLVPWCTGLDEWGASQVESWRSCGTERAADWLSDRVQPTGLVLVVTAAALRARWRHLVESIGAFLAGTLLLESLKQAVDRSRPGAEFLDALGHGFPSGHVGNTILAGATLLALWGGASRARLAFVAAAAAPVAMARLLLGQHWVTDVLGSALLFGGYAALALLHPAVRVRRMTTIATAATAFLLLAAAAAGVRLRLPTAGGTAETVVSRIAFGDALRDGALRGAWVPDGPDPRRRSAWTKAEQGRLVIASPATPAAMLRIVGRPFAERGTACRRFELQINGASLGTRLMHTGWRAYTFALPAGQLRAEDNVVTIAMRGEEPAPAPGAAMLAAFSELTLHTR